ncbi:hypothetical protein ACPVPU_03845 [Sphingomonas sp. CJ99]
MAGLIWPLVLGGMAAAMPGRQEPSCGVDTLQITEMPADRDVGVTVADEVGGRLRFKRWSLITGVLPR